MNETATMTKKHAAQPLPGFKGLYRVEMAPGIFHTVRAGADRQYAADIVAGYNCPVEECRRKSHGSCVLRSEARTMAHLKGRNLRLKVESGEWHVAADGVLRPNPDHKPCLCWHTGWGPKGCPLHKVNETA